MATPHDVLLLKTDAELRFFVENPGYYQAELVEAARRELRRRYPDAAVPAPAPQPFAAPELHEEAPRRPARVLLLSIGGVLLVAGLGFWGKAGWWHSAPAAQPVAAKPAPPAPLETAISAPPLPTFDVEHCVEQALAKVPAAEKSAQPLSQYQAIGRRFWAAQQPSAYLLGQVQHGQANPLFKAQAGLVLDLWRDFDRTLIYSYKFGPVMHGQFTRMKTIANYQREALAELVGDAEANRPLHLDSPEQQAGQLAVPSLLAPLEPKARP